MKHKILMSAFSCLPFRGSEPGVGWNWAIEAAKTQEVYVLTRTKCQEKIEKELNANPISNLHFLYCDSNANLRKMSILLEYFQWQWRAYLFLKGYVKNESFDYLIHITFGNMFLPLWIYKLDIPFIWGPIGGGETVPSIMYKRFNLKDRIPHMIKNFLNKTVKYNPFVLAPARKAKLIIAMKKDTKKIFPIRFHNKIEIRLETCINNNEFSELCKFHNNQRCDNINLTYTGRLIAFKNVELILDSLKRIVENYPFIKLHLIGDGNKKQQLQAMVKNYNLENNVVFHGMLNRQESLKIVEKSDIYVFPSLREGGTWSLMEAMALGKPVVCINRTGMEIITDDTSAIRIEIKDYDEMVDDFARAIVTLINDPDLRIKMGESGKKRMNDIFSWDCIGEYIVNTLDNLDKIN